MINIQYAYKENDLLNPFMERQLKEANLEGYPLVKWGIDLNPMLTAFKDIVRHHTLIFSDNQNIELLRIEGPFDSKRAEEGLLYAKGILSSRLKTGEAKL